MIYVELFWAFFQIGAFSFGGGYAAMPLIQAQVIDKYHWMSMQSFTDLVTISQMTPGPIAINAATFVGNQVAGIPGAVIATIGDILPSCILVTILAFLYTRYRKLALLQEVLKTLRPAVVALIFAAGLQILIPAVLESRENVVYIAGHNIQLRIVVYFLAALFLLRKTKWNPIAIMAGCGMAELAARLFTTIPLQWFG